MNATDILIDEEVFRFTGQSRIDTWSLRDHLVSSSSRYSRWLVADIHLTMQRIRELDDTAIEAIKAYLRVRTSGKDAKADAYLFISRMGDALKDGGVYDIVRECGVRAGIKRNMFPHLFRHTKLLDLIEQDVNPWWVMEFAGQEHIQSLEPYIHSGIQKKRREMIRSVPLLGSHDGTGGFDNGDEEPTVSIDNGPTAGNGKTIDRLLQALIDGKISEATYNRTLEAITRGEVSLSQK